MSGVGIDRLLAGLAADGAASLLLPGVDEEITAPEYVRRVLELARPRGMTFDEAWAVAVNRLQVPAIDGLDVAATVREERTLLEEVKPRWRAAYEGREPSPRERVLCHRAVDRHFATGLPGI